MKRENLHRLAALFLAAVLLLSACVRKPQDPADGTQGSSQEPSSTATEPTATDPTVTDPTVTEPTVTDPTVTEPTVTEPPTTESRPTEPNPTKPKPTVTEPPTTEPTIPDLTGAHQITLTFTGDCTFGRNQKASYTRSFDEMYDQKGAKYFFNKVRDIFEKDDITIINLEGSLTTSTDIQEKMWNHKGDPKYVKIMTTSSVEVATMGNNHRLDYGVSGFEETMNVLDQAGISYCYDDRYLVYEVKGFKIGFVSVNEVYDGWKVESWLKEGYQKLHEQGCHAIVACIHWGGDKTPVIEDYQITLGRKAVDWGYDLVVGNHPHVLQSIEVYKGKFICYSLGNFCYGGNKNPDDKDSGIFQQTFTFVDEVLVEDYNARFIPCSLSGVTYRNDYQPTPSTGSEYRRIIEKMNAYSEEFGFALDQQGRPARVNGEYVSVHVHEFEDRGTITASCTQDGYHLRECICGMEERTELQPALGHSYSEFVSNGDATCASDGTKSATCSRCGTQVTVTDSGTATGHKYEIESVTEPTIWAEGYTTYLCPVCGERYMADFTSPMAPEQFQRRVAEEIGKAIADLRAGQSLDTVLPPGLTLVAELRAAQLVADFAPSETALQEACQTCRYGNLTEEKYSIVAMESILRLSEGGTTAKAIAQRAVQQLAASDYGNHLSNAENLYIGIGAVYDSGTGEWFSCILQTAQNYG